MKIQFPFTYLFWFFSGLGIILFFIVIIFTFIVTVMKLMSWLLFHERRRFFSYGQFQISSLIAILDVKLHEQKDWLRRGFIREIELRKEIRILEEAVDEMHVFKMEKEEQKTRKIKPKTKRKSDLLRSRSLEDLMNTSIESTRDKPADLYRNKSIEYAVDASLLEMSNRLGDLSNGKKMRDLMKETIDMKRKKIKRIELRIRIAKMKLENRRIKKMIEDASFHEKRVHQQEDTIHRKVKQVPSLEDEIFRLSNELHSIQKKTLYLQKVNRQKQSINSIRKDISNLQTHKTTLKEQLLNMKQRQFHETKHEPMNQSMQQSQRQSKSHLELKRIAMNLIPELD